MADDSKNSLPTLFGVDPYFSVLVFLYVGLHPTKLAEEPKSWA